MTDQRSNRPPESIGNTQLARTNWQRWAWSIAGGICFVLGIIGLALPVLPTTPFMLLTAACWAKSSKRFYDWLINHRLFGKMIRDWQANGAIPISAKVTAIAMMTISCTALFLKLPTEKIWLAWVSLALCVGVAGWLVSRPSQ